MDAPPFSLARNVRVLYVYYSACVGVRLEVCVLSKHELRSGQA